MSPPGPPPTFSLLDADEAGFVPLDAMCTQINTAAVRMLTKGRTESTLLLMMDGIEWQFLFPLLGIQESGSIKLLLSDNRQDGKRNAIEIVSLDSSTVGSLSSRYFQSQSESLDNRYR